MRSYRDSSINFVKDHEATNAVATTDVMLEGEHDLKFHARAIFAILGLKSSPEFSRYQNSTPSYPRIQRCRHVLLSNSEFAKKTGPEVP